MSKGHRIGYIRVSTLDQNTERQLDGIEFDLTFTDKASGKDTNRPELQAALRYARESDTLVVYSMDRLARRGGPVADGSRTDWPGRDRRVRQEPSDVLGQA